MSTAKLVSDYMTDCKFTLFQKEQQTVVCFGDKIAWLVNERTDNRFAVDEQTRTILVMKIEQ
jgi:tRNA(Ile)-lysidine synthase